MEGRTFSHYRVLEKLGGGGMGVVYTALDTNLDRKVALKFLPPELTQDDAARTRLVQEAKAASALDHRNICTIYDIDESPDGQLCIAMAHYGGGTLKERLSRGVLSLDDALDIAIQLADGLAEAHRAAIVHRDIKPENAVLSNTGEVKIVDFGPARVLSQVTATQSGTTRGTPGYMSPEQILGQEIRESTDVWSLGVVLYEMITARSPFRGDHAHALLYAIVHEDPPPVGDLRPDVAPELLRIVMKTLAKDPDARYRDARDLLADLRGCREAMQSAARDTRRDDAVIDPEGETQDLAPAQRGGSPVRSQEHVVGRVTQLEQLRAAYQAAAAGRGGIVCVTGEPGIGKTTLVETFLSEIEHGAEPCRVARGRCSERLAGAEGYLPILETVESVVAGRARVENQMKEVAPTWYVQTVPRAEASGRLSTAMIDDAKAASQERMKRELSAFLDTLSREASLVIFLDDLHWANASTVDLLSYIGGRSGSMRLLIIATYRPSDLLRAKHPFHQVQLELQSHGLCRELPLEYLSPTDVEDYLSLEFAGHRFPPNFGAMIHDRTEGNPMFAIDLLRDLRTRGAISHQSGEWTLTQSTGEIQRDIPDSVRGMIGLKIAKLSDDDRRLLTAASVQGSRLPFGCRCHCARSRRDRRRGTARRTRPDVSVDPTGRRA